MSRNKSRKSLKLDFQAREPGSGKRLTRFQVIRLIHAPLYGFVGTNHPSPSPIFSPQQLERRVKVKNDLCHFKGNPCCMSMHTLRGLFSGLVEFKELSQDFAATFKKKSDILNLSLVQGSGSFLTKRAIFPPFPTIFFVWSHKTYLIA